MTTDTWRLYSGFQSTCNTITNVLCCAQTQTADSSLCSIKIPQGKEITSIDSKSQIRLNEIGSEGNYFTDRHLSLTTNDSLQKRYY